MYINSEAAIPLVWLAYEFMYMELCKVKDETIHWELVKMEIA